MADNPRGGRSNWFRIANKTPDVAEVYIYDSIGEWGKPASEFVSELKAVKANEIQLHVNSPGGDVFDAIAILNTLRAHPARVVATVDGLAASSASFIVQAGDEIVMSRNSEMMIHDASGLAIGNVKVMQELAERLDAASNNIASIYAERAGGTLEEWREVMQAETWFSAQEAVAAGLADRVDEAKSADDSIKARFDLSIFNHAGRSAAPQPHPPSRPQAPVDAVSAMHRIHNAPVKGSITEKEGSDMSDTLIEGMRERLGLPAGASEADVLTAYDALRNSTTPPDPQPDPDPTPPDPEPAPAPKKVAGTITIDASAWDEREERIKRLEASAAKRAREERDQVISAAVQDGKFAPARKEHWARLWDADPEGTREVLAGLHKNIVPVEALGSGADDGDDLDAEFAGLFPPVGK